jgi:hypothetical protein
LPVAELFFLFWYLRLSPAVSCICIWFEHKREMNPVAERRRVCSNVAQIASASSRQLPPAGARIERTVEGEVGTRARTELGRAARAAGDPCGRRRAGGREAAAHPSSEEPAAVPHRAEGGCYLRLGSASPAGARRSPPPTREGSTGGRGRVRLGSPSAGAAVPRRPRRPGYAPPVAAEGGGGASRRPPPESLRSRGLVRICAAFAWKWGSRAREEEATTVGGRAEGRGAGTRETR